MNYQLLGFFIFASIAIFGALMVVLKKNPVASAFALIAVFFSFAGMYALMSAHLIAALQILVYTGAIMVLFVFVIMLLNQDHPVGDLKSTSGLFKAGSALAVIGLVAVLIRVMVRSKEITPTGTLTDEAIAAQGGNVRLISESIFTDHLVHFELTSFLLLGAIVATIALAKRKVSRGGSEA